MEQNQQTIIRHYLQEMEALRSEGLDFAKSYPEVARELGMGAESWSDPQAEMLVQSFAYLSARIRNQIDIDKSTVPNALLNHISPHMQASLPCMAVAEAQAVSSADGRCLDRGRTFTVEAEVSKRRLNCRFKNCYDTPIWPLEIDSIETLSVSDVDFIDSSEARSEVRSVARVRIKTNSNDPIQDLDIYEKGLRFFVSARSRSALWLYDLLNTSLCEIYIKTPNQEDPPRVLEAGNLVWRGFEDEDAVLPDRADIHPGYRLIREYFAFPQKFLFFDLEKVELQGVQDSFDIYFAFSDALPKGLGLSSDVLKLNCFPVINLFEQPIEPIRLNQRRYEYSVDADRINQSYSEVYSIESLYALKTGEAPRKISPCFELSEFEATEELGYFYSFRRELSNSERIPGTKTFVAFHDHSLSLSDVPAEAIGGTALCTNRRLAEKLNGQSAVLLLEGAGPITGAKLASRVTPYTPPRLDEHAAWRLVSQLSLNFLSISGSEKALDTFKNILESYADTSNPVVLKQIQSLKSIQPERQSRYIHRAGKSGMAQGLKIRLNVDEQVFMTAASPILFASVCRYFFALYASLGTFVQLVLETDKRGEWKTWPPMAGALVEL